MRREAASRFDGGFGDLRTSLLGGIARGSAWNGGHGNIFSDQRCLRPLPALPGHDITIASASDRTRGSSPLVHSHDLHFVRGRADIDTVSAGVETNAVLAECSAGVCDFC